MSDYYTHAILSQGKEQGRFLERARIAQNLLYMGFDFEIIHFSTNISKEEFVKIKKDYLKLKSNFNFNINNGQIKEAIHNHV